MTSFDVVMIEMAIKMENKYYSINELNTKSVFNNNNKSRHIYQNCCLLVIKSINNVAIIN